MPLNDDLDALTQTFRADQHEFDAGPLVRCVWALYSGFVAEGAKPTIAMGLALGAFGTMVTNAVQAQQTQQAQQPEGGQV